MVKAYENNNNYICFLDVSKRRRASNDALVSAKPKGPDRGLITFANPQTKAATISKDSNTHLNKAALSINNPSEVILASQKPDVLCNVDAQPTRIGILRRSDASLTAPMKNEADNLISSNHLTLTDSVSTLPDSSQLNLNVTSNESPPYLSIPNVGLKSATLSESNASNRYCSASSNKLTTSNKNKTSPADPSIQPTQQTQINVPYWLKPSPLQVYPYNFIMAVRKKLEMIANPISRLPIKNQVSVTDKAVQSTPVGRPKYFQKKHSSTAFRRNLERSETEQASPVSIEEPSKSKSLSEALTNLSSMSLHVPDTSNSKVVAKGSSDSEGTLSISSAIFSQSSPEKKNPNREIAPLSMANIENLNLNVVQGKFKHPFINTRRGCGEDPHYMSNPTSISSDIIHNKSLNVDPTEMADMLNSFNQSLSHAIAVNQQLTNVLKNVPQSTSRSSEKSRRSIKNAQVDTAEDEYSSKFESATTSGHNTNRESILANESSIHSSSLASESTSARNVSEYDAVNIPKTDRSISKEFSSNLSPIISTNLSERRSVIVKSASNLSDSNAISSTTAPSITDNPKSEQIASKHSSSVISFAPKSIQDSLSSAISTHRSSSSIRTELSDMVTRAEQSPAGKSVRSVSVKSSGESPRSLDNDHHSNQIPGQQHMFRDSIIPETEHQSNKENISSSLNTDGTIATAPSTKKRSSSISESIGDNTIQESTVEFKAHDGFQTYRLENVLSINTRNESAADWTPKKIPVDPNQSIGSDIFAAFNQTDMLELSIMSANETTMSDANLSYATLGMVKILF